MASRRQRATKTATGWRMSCMRRGSETGFVQPQENTAKGGPYGYLQQEEPGYSVRWQDEQARENLNKGKIPLKIKEKKKIIVVVVKHKNRLPRGVMEPPSLETFQTRTDTDYKQVDLTLNLDQTLKIGPAGGQMTSCGLPKPQLFYEPITYANRWKSITTSEVLHFTTQITIKAIETIRHQHLRSWRGMKNHCTTILFTPEWCVTENELCTYQTGHCTLWRVQSHHRQWWLQEESQGSH